MNALQTFLRVSNRTSSESASEVFYLNLCQSRGFVSDLCVTAAEVYPLDAAHAVRRITGRTLEKYLQWWNAGRKENECAEVEARRRDEREAIYA